MTLGEFDLIDRHFRRPYPQRNDIPVGIGDDAAVVVPTAGQELVVTTDVLNEGVHFPPGTPAKAIGHKALAVNLSDLAAMGAQPRWFTMTLSLVRANDDWLASFTEGLFALADQHDIALIGGDTVSGPLSIGIQAMGEVPKGGALRRAGAQPGDRILVSGTIGDAALALQGIQQGEDQPVLRERLEWPQPRIALGQALRGLATSCIDLSDGLCADLGHILEASGCAATINSNQVPLSEAYRKSAGDNVLPALTGGDDYELCFTVPADSVVDLDELSAELELPLTEIGTIKEGSGLTVLDDYGQSIPLPHPGYEHFGDAGE